MPDWENESGKQNDRVIAAVAGARNRQYIFEFLLKDGDTLHVNEYKGKPLGTVEHVTERDMVVLAKTWLDKWCARRKVSCMRIFVPHVAAEVMGEE